MFKKALATGMLTVLGCGVFGVTAANAEPAQPNQPIVDVNSLVGQHDQQAAAVHRQIRETLDKLDSLRLPANSPMRARVEQTKNQLRALDPATAAGPLCSVVNTVLNTAYELLRSLGVPNGPDIGLPDFPNPCAMQLKPATS